MLLLLRALQLLTTKLLQQLPKGLLLVMPRQFAVLVLQLLAARGGLAVCWRQVVPRLEGEGKREAMWERLGPPSGYWCSFGFSRESAALEKGKGSDLLARTALVRAVLVQIKGMGGRE